MQNFILSFECTLVKEILYTDKKKTSDLSLVS